MVILTSFLAASLFLGAGKRESVIPVFLCDANSRNQQNCPGFRSSDWTPEKVNMESWKWAESNLLSGLSKVTFSIPKPGPLSVNTSTEKLVPLEFSIIVNLKLLQTMVIWGLLGLNQQGTKIRNQSLLYPSRCIESMTRNQHEGYIFIYFQVHLMLICSWRNAI